jgi:hypothetical protein
MRWVDQPCRHGHPSHARFRRRWARAALNRLNAQPPLALRSELVQVVKLHEIVEIPVEELEHKRVVDSQAHLELAVELPSCGRPELELALDSAREQDGLHDADALPRQRGVKLRVRLVAKYRVAHQP